MNAFCSAPVSGCFGEEWPQLWLVILDLSMGTDAMVEAEKLPNCASELHSCLSDMNANNLIHSTSMNDPSADL